MKMYAEYIKNAIKQKYQQPEWAVFFEVANGTGANARRYADAMAFNMYPSKGFEIIGFEVKVSRGDLLHELKHPEKADEIGQFCDTWYLVTPKGLIKDKDDIPTYWGVIEVSQDGSTRIKKRAIKKEALQINKTFMMAVLRRASQSGESLFNQMVSLEVEKRTKQTLEQNEKRFEQKLKNEIYMLDKGFNKKIEFYDKFVEALGEESLGYWDNDRMIQNIKFAKKCDINGYSGVFKAVESIENSIKNIKKYKPEE